MCTQNTIKKSLHKTGGLELSEKKNKVTFEKEKGSNSMEVALDLHAGESGAKAGISFLIEGLVYPEHLPAQKTSESRILSLGETKALVEKLEEFIRQGEKFVAEN